MRAINLSIQGSVQLRLIIASDRRDNQSYCINVIDNQLASVSSSEHSCSMFCHYSSNKVVKKT